MGRNRFTRLATRQIMITDGDWIEVKEGLTYGEQQYLANASLTSVHFKPGQEAEQGSEIGLDMKRHAMLRIFVWVTDWSFNTENGKRTQVTMPNIEALDPDTAQEINDALDTHSDNMRRAKNELAAATPPTLIHQHESRTIIDVPAEGNFSSVDG